MKTTVITSKGTTTIPKEVRDSLGLVPGSSVNFTVKNGVAYIERALTLDEVRAQNARLIPKVIAALPTTKILEMAREKKAAELKEKYGL
jgi:AbrB family looped-hinge helix DNA binding protein